MRSAAQLTPPRWTKIVQCVEKRHNEYDEIYLTQERRAALEVW